MDGYLAKPIQPDALFAEIESVLDRLKKGDDDACISADHAG
jgi:DNA-binding response OmpR family regulator